MERMIISDDFSDWAEHNVSDHKGDFLPVEVVENEGGRAMVMAEFFSLPVMFRVALLARYYMMFDLSEMASVFQTSPRQVSTFLAGAETMLKWRMEVRLGRKLPYGNYSGREPTLARLYRQDAEIAVTPEIRGRLERFVARA